MEGLRGGGSLKDLALRLVLRKFSLPLLITALCLILALLIVMGGLMLLFMLSPNGDRGSNTWRSGEISEIGVNEIPAQYLQIYHAAAETYHVPWNLLAAHHRVETRFSTMQPMISPVGAVGHMQFMPATWAGWRYASDGVGNVRAGVDITNPQTISKGGGYGVDADGDGKADPFDLEDAIYTAASFLAKNGAGAGDLRSAIYAYNHSDSYVSEVLMYADLYVKGGMVVGGGSGRLAWPLPFTRNLTTRFGDVDEAHATPHNGIDIASPGVEGQTVVAAADGRVKVAGRNGGYGLCVVIDHGGGFQTLYGHLSSVGVALGERIDAGQEIGRVGSTGKSTGPHLHFEVDLHGVAVDPLKYL